MNEDVLTPVQVERKLRSLVNDMTAAQQLLRDARDREVAAKHRAEREERLAFFSPKCPKVERGGTTVAERDAWVDQEAAEAREAYEVAEATRKAAEDHLRTIRDTAMIVMALGKSVNQAYGLSGYSP